MPMPSVEDLQTMYGAWNPEAYLTAQSNAGLERQYRESEYAGQQERVRKATLDNLFQEQDDPERLRERQLSNRNKELTNTGLGYKNDSEALDLEHKQALHSLNLDADKRKALLQVTTDQLAEADQQVELMRRSLDPAIQAKGEKLFKLTGAARALQAQRDAAMELEKYKQGEESKRSAGNNATSIKVAEIGAKSRIDAAGKRGGTTNPIAVLSKLSPDKRLGPVKAILDSGIDPETDEPLTSAARAYYESMYAQDVRTQDAKGNMVPQQPVLDPTTNKLVAPTPRPSVGDTKPTKRGTGTKEDPIVLK